MLFHMNSDQFRRHLTKQGCTIDAAKGKGGHVLIRNGDKTSVLPTHGGTKQLGTGLMCKIIKDLGLE
jgi:mRNA interferase HicA